METQNYAHHKQYVPLFHGMTFLLILVFGIGSFVNLKDALAEPDELLSAILLVLVFIILVLIGFYARLFALRAQDRAIRAEENLRHFVLTGKLLDPKLRMGQIIALRFAPDDEFVALAKKALTENMKPDDIKKAVKNWKADYNRA